MGADDNSDSVQQVLSEHLIKVDQAIDSGLSAASDAVRSGTAVALEEVEKATGFAKVNPFALFANMPTFFWAWSFSLPAQFSRFSDRNGSIALKSG